MIPFVKGDPFTVCMESFKPSAVQNSGDISDYIVFVNIRKPNHVPVMRMNTQQHDHAGKFSVQLDKAVLSVTFLPGLISAFERGCYRCDILLYDPVIRRVISSVFFKIRLR